MNAALLNVILQDAILLNVVLINGLKLVLSNVVLLIVTLKPELANVIRTGVVLLKVAALQ
jgi:hypothetical protein